MPLLPPTLVSSWVVSQISYCILPVSLLPPLPTHDWTFILFYDNYHVPFTDLDLGKDRRFVHLGRLYACLPPTHPVPHLFTVCRTPPVHLPCHFVPPSHSVLPCLPPPTPGCAMPALHICHLPCMPACSPIPFPSTTCNSLFVCVPTHHYHSAAMHYLPPMCHFTCHHFPQLLHISSVPTCFPYLPLPSHTCLFPDISACPTCTAVLPPSLPTLPVPSLVLSHYLSLLPIIPPHACLPPP